MCGLAGIISQTGSHLFDIQIQNMTNLLKHRGPDDEGFYINKEEGAYLGFRRLSIIDLSINASQPMANENGEIILIINGEIYNYKSLRSELTVKGHRFVSRSDSEVVLHSYEEWGESCVERLEGMFAYAIWDRQNKRLVLARDRIGIKPLYFLNTNKFFAFASELKAFLALNNKAWQPEFEEEILDLYFHFPFIPENRKSILRGIEKVPPGHLLILKNNSFELRRYWDLKKKGFWSAKSFEEATDKLDSLLSSTIETHLQSDVPVGLLLSGGIDSSLMTAIAKKKTPDLNTFTAGFDHPLDESVYAQKVSQLLQTRHYPLKINLQEIIERFEELIWLFDDLSCIDGGMFTIYMLCQEIKQQGIKVLLVGEGADEVFGGYHLFKLSLFPFNRLPISLRNWVYFYMISGFLFRREFLPYTRFLRKEVNYAGRDVHRQISQFEIKTQLPNYLLMKVDKATMAQSVEARVPYLDHKLVEFIYGLPRNYKMKGAYFSRRDDITKYILRNVSHRYLPDAVANRRKQGFMLPGSEVIKQGKDKIRTYLSDPNAFVRGLFPKTKLEKILSNIESNTFFVWRLFILELWAQRYLTSKLSN
jgi:asparagine synthase (glutamine-hydrolysing)